MARLHVEVQLVSDYKLLHDAGEKCGLKGDVLDAFIKSGTRHTLLYAVDPVSGKANVVRLDDAIVLEV